MEYLEIQRQNIEKKKEYNILLKENQELINKFYELTYTREKEFKNLYEVDDDVYERYRLNLFLKKAQKELAKLSNELSKEKEELKSIKLMKVKLEKEKSMLDEKIDKLQRKAEELNDFWDTLNEEDISKL